MTKTSCSIFCSILALVSLGLFNPRAEAQNPNVQFLYDDTPYSGGSGPANNPGDINVLYWAPPSPTPATNDFTGTNWYYATGNSNIIPYFGPYSWYNGANFNGQNNDSRPFIDDQLTCYAAFWDDFNISATSNAYKNVQFTSNNVGKGLDFIGQGWNLQNIANAYTLTLTSERYNNTIYSYDEDRQAITLEAGSQATIGVNLALGGHYRATPLSPPSSTPAGNQYFNLGANSSLTITGNIIGVNTLNIQGSAGSVLTLSGNNTFSGGLVLDDSAVTGAYGRTTTPRLNMDSGQALGTGSLTISGGLEILGNTSGSALTITNPIIILSNIAGTTGTYVQQAGPQAVETENLVFDGANDLTLTSNLALTVNRAISVESGGGALILGGQISGADSLFKNLSGNLVLSSTNNTYTGATVVNGGVLSVTHLANGGLSSSIGASGDSTAKGSSGISVLNVSTSGSVAPTAVTSSTPIPNLVLGGGGTLSYAGTGDSTDRPIGIFPGQYNFTDAITPVSIDSSGTGALKFTNPGPILEINLLGQARSLVLTGTNTDANTFNLAFTDNRNTGGTRGDNSLTKNGGGTWIDSGNNTYTGGTTVNAGKLILTGTNTVDAPTTNTITTGGTSSAGPGTFTVNGGMLQFGKTASFYNSTITSATAAQLTVASGATGAFSVGGTGEFTSAQLDTLRGSASFASGSFFGIDTTDASGGTFTYGSNIGGPIGLNKLSSGILVLTGTNTYTGGSVVSGGGLQFANTAAFNGNTIDPSRLSVASGATAAFNVGGTGEFTLAEVNVLRAGGSFASGAYLGFDTTNAPGGTLTYSSNLSDSPGIAKLGSGTLTLGGTSTYTGANVFGGTLQLADSGTSLASTAAVTMTGGTLAFGLSDQTLGSLSGTGGTINLFDSVGHQLTVNSSASTTYAGGITGILGSLEKTGTGTLTLSGTNTYTGATTVDSGTLQFAKTIAFYNSATDGLTFSKLSVAAGATAAFNVGGTGEFTSTHLDALFGNSLLASGSTVSLDTTNASGGTFTYAGNIGGAVALSKLGTGTLVLSGASTFTGGVTLNAGTLSPGSDTGLGSGMLTINGGALQGAGGARTLGNAVALNSSFTLGRSTNLAGAVTLGNDVTITSDNVAAGAATTSTLSGVISGAHGLTFADGTNPTGTTVLSGTNTYTGGTTLNSGTLQLGNSGTVLADTGTVTINGGTFRLGAANETIGALGGTGGTVDLSNGPGRILTMSGNSSTAFAGAIIGSGGALVQAGTGMTTLSGANTYTGGTTVSNGILQFANTAAFNNNTIDATRLSVASGATAAFNVGGAGEFTAANLATLQTGGSFATGAYLGIDTTNASGGNLTFSGNTSGVIGLAKFGTGTLTLGDDSSYTGIAVYGGTLQLKDDATATFAPNAAVMIDGGTLAFARGRSSPTGYQWYIGSLAGSGGTVQLYAGDYQGQNLHITGSANTTYAGTITGFQSELILDGTGTLTLTGTNDYSSGADDGGAGIISTTINGGTLQLGNGGISGSITGNISDNGNLTIDRSDNFANSNQISGTGSVTKLGTDTIVLVMNDTYTGGTTISGTLQLGDGGTTGLIVGDVANNGALVVDRSDTVGVSGNISGTGSLAQTGAGITVLSGTNSYSGGTMVSSGILQFAKTASFNNNVIDPTRLSVAAGATGAFNVGGPGEFTAANIDALRLGGSFASGAYLGFDATNATGGTFTYTNTLGGSVGVTTLGTGTVVLGGTSTYIGANVLGGTLELNDSGTSLNSNSQVTMNGGTLALGQSDQTIGSLCGIADLVTFHDVANNPYTVNETIINLLNGSGRRLTVNESSNTTFGGAINGAGGSLQKEGTGTLTLTGTNTYSGGTNVTAGTLTVGNNSALGTAAVNVSGGTLQVPNGYQVANTIDLSGGTLAQGVVGGTPFSTLHDVNSTVSGGVAATAQLLGGQSSGAANVQETFSHLSVALNDNVRLSDVLSFSGVAVVNEGTGQTDTFVLQLKLNPALLTSNAYLGWLNPATDQWTNAVAGNDGGTINLIPGAYNSATDFVLGDYGIDTTNGTVWAVLDHNSDFAVAVVPEPSTWIMLASGLGLLIFLENRKRRMAHR